MHFAYNPYMLLPLFAMVMALFLAYRGLRYRSTVMGKTYLMLMLALAWWSFAVDTRALQHGPFSQDHLDTNVLLWHHRNSSCVASIHLTIYQEGKMDNTAQSGVIVHSAGNYTRDRLDQWHLSFDVEGHLDEYQFFPTDGCCHA